MTRAPTAASAASLPLWPSSTSARCSNHTATVLQPPSQGTLTTLPTVLQPLYPDAPASQQILQPPCPGTPTPISSPRPASPARPWDASVLKSRLSEAPCAVCSCSSAPCSRRQRLHRGVADAILVSPGPAEGHLGGVGQCHLPRCLATAQSDPRCVALLEHEIAKGILSRTDSSDFG